MTRHGRWLIASAALLVLLSLVAYWGTRPQRVSALVMRQIGSALGLEITAKGASEYRLRGGPRLVLRDVVARVPGSQRALLRAERIDVAVPWSTARSRGAQLDITRVELDAPILDVRELQAWLATRPESEQRTPTLTNGVRVRDGQVLGEGWSLDDIALDVPRVLPEQPVDARVSGRFVQDTMRVPFALTLAMTKPANGAGLSVHGSATLEQPERRLAMQLRLSGPLQIDDAGVRIVPLRASVAAQLKQDDLDLPFAFALNGPLRVEGNKVSLSPAGVALRGDDLVPDIDGRAAFAYTTAASLHLEGTLAQWPETWPALPPPIGQSTAPLPFVLDYSGGFDLASVARLQATRDDTHFDGRFRLPEVLAWVDATDASPLPPMTGRITTPQLEIAGAVLEGVDVRIEDPTVDAAP